MSLSNRLDRMLSSNTAADLDQFRQMTVQEMGQAKVTFGKTHMGRTFSEVWTEERTWVKWFTKAYQDSQKAEHQKFLIYVDKMVSEHEQTLGLPQMETSRQEIVQPRCKTAPKAKAASRPAQSAPWMETVSDFGTDTWDVMDPESLVEGGTLISHEEHNQQNIEDLQQRMMHVEGALMEILNQVRANNN